MNKREILILGKIPPPIGGVTIHTSRLVASLKERNYQHFHFLDLHETSIPRIFVALIKFPVTHLHTSHVYFQFFASILCLITNRKLIITYHGNLGRYQYFKNLIVNASCRLCFLPIVQNQASLQKASIMNEKALLVSAYIPTRTFPSQYPEIIQMLTGFKKLYSHVFCTNACNVTFDKSGNETYGISDLINKFSTMPEAALVISDPSGRYKRFVETLMMLPDNILFISNVHDFSDVLRYTDAFIRNTTTDGDSISIHEAMAAQSIVFATNCVPRPTDCILYNNIYEIDLISEVQNTGCVETERKQEDIVDILVKIYDRALNG